MNLKTYRTKNNVKMTEVAAAVGKSVQHLYEIERGIAFPSRKLAKALSVFTDGAIRAEELLYPNEKPRRKRAA